MHKRWIDNVQILLKRPHAGCSRRILASFSTATSNTNRAQPHTNESTAHPRHYFYDVDVHGQLFLSDTQPKTIATCYKDTRFLDFFFSRLRLVDAESDLARQGYRYVSACAGELNFVRAADVPIVFVDLEPASDGYGLLQFAGTKSCEFLPSQLVACKRSGRLYHPLPQRFSELNLSMQHDEQPQQDRNGWIPTPASFHAPALGLIRSSVLVSRLSDGLDLDRGTLEYQGKTFELRWID